MGDAVVTVTATTIGGTEAAALTVRADTDGSKLRQLLAEQLRRRVKMCLANGTLVDNTKRMFEVFGMNTPETHEAGAAATGCRKDSADVAAVGDPTARLQRELPPCVSETASLSCVSCGGYVGLRSPQPVLPDSCCPWIDLQMSRLFQSK